MLPNHFHQLVFFPHTCFFCLNFLPARVSLAQILTLWKKKTNAFFQPRVCFLGSLPTFPELPTWLQTLGFAVETENNVFQLFPLLILELTFLWDVLLMKGARAESAAPTRPANTGRVGTVCSSLQGTIRQKTWQERIETSSRKDSFHASRGWRKLGEA